MSLDLDAIKARATKHGNLVHGADALWVARASADDVPALLAALAESRARECNALCRDVEQDRDAMVPLVEVIKARLLAPGAADDSDALVAAVERVAAAEQDRDRLIEQAITAERQRILGTPDDPCGILDRYEIKAHLNGDGRPMHFAYCARCHHVIVIARDLNGSQEGVTLAEVAETVMAHEDEEHAEALQPCQPIGCDNGYHLPGCQFADIDAAEASGTEAGR